MQGRTHQHQRNNTMQCIRCLLQLDGHSPNSCLPTWGPSGGSLYPVVVAPFFPALTASFFSHVLVNINIFELYISKCCCGPRQSTKSVVRHSLRRTAPFHFLAVVIARINISKYIIPVVRQPQLSRKSSKNIKDIHQILGAFFLSPSARRTF